MSNLTIRHTGNQPDESWEAPNATKEEKQTAKKDSGIVSKIKGFFKK